MSPRFFWVCTVLIFVLIGANMYHRQSRAPVASGNALIGGAFTLVDTEGKAVGDAVFRGRLMLVYFGFSHCPDICPTDLSRMTRVMEALGKDADRVAALFITVDPERDTPEVLTRYMQNFHPAIHALTGTRTQVDAALQAYRVFAEQMRDPALEGYMMNHSSFTYLLDKEGRYITHFPSSASADAIVDAVRPLL